MAFVEGPGARVLLKDPEHRLVVARRGEPPEPGDHEGAPDPAAPMCRVDVAAVHLPHAVGWNVGVPACPGGQPSGDLAVGDADEDDAPVRLGREDLRLPAGGALGQVPAEAFEEVLWDDIPVTLLPRPDVGGRDATGIADNRLSHDEDHGRFCHRPPFRPGAPSTNTRSYTSFVAIPALAEASPGRLPAPLPGGLPAPLPGGLPAPLPGGLPAPCRPSAERVLPALPVLPVLPALAGLFPAGGLPRGGTVLLGPAGTPPEAPSKQEAGPAAPVEAGPAAPVPGLTSLLISLVAGVSSEGHWCAVVGLPELGIAAAHDLGADLGRLVLVPEPGREGCWQSVVATLLEIVELVCLVPGAPVRPGDARRLTARAREHSSTLLVLDAAARCGAGAAGSFASSPGRPGRRPMAHWPGPTDLRCAVAVSSWSGLGCGHGLLSSRQLEAEVSGRGAASHPRRGLLELPA